jgi:hypothetical protein
MPKATRDYGFARECSVCGAKINGTPGCEIVVSTGQGLHDPLDRFPQCYYCDRQNQSEAELMVLWRIASGAYKIQKRQTISLQRGRFVV